MRNLSEFIAVYDDALDAQLCDDMVANFHSLKQFQARNGAGVREGLEDSGWTEMNVTALADIGFKRHFEGQLLKFFARYNAEIHLSLPLSPLTKVSDLMLKHYRAESRDRFQLHFDSIRAHSNRYLVFLWYLNDVAEGGETVFPDLDVSVKPKKGRLLMFPPYWQYQHAGLSPKSGDKYIVSAYALY